MDYPFRPLLADAQKIGFFSLDRAVQTEESDVVKVKELTAIVEQLLEVLWYITLFFNIPIVVLNFRIQQ